MCVEDLVKLIYQGEFGGGHIIPDESSALSRLLDEWERLPFVPQGEPLIEDIGYGILRLNLAPAKSAGLDPRTVNRIFVLSANSVRGDVGALSEKLEVLRCLCESGALPFEAGSIGKYLADYAKDGYPATSHSETYKKAYSPAYRVIKDEYGGIIDALIKTDSAFAAGEIGCELETAEFSQRFVGPPVRLLGEVYGPENVSGPTLRGTVTIRRLV